MYVKDTVKILYKYRDFGAQEPLHFRVRKHAVMVVILVPKDLPHFTPLALAQFKEIKQRFQVFHCIFRLLRQRGGRT